MRQSARVMTAKLRSALSVSRTVPLSTLPYSFRAILSARPGAALLQHPAYVPIADVLGLPRILLLGDSISIGYTLPVRQAMKRIANIHRPPANCTSSRNATHHLEEWLGSGPWAIVHANFGLHDCVRDHGESAVPIDEYRGNLVRVFRRLRDTGAQLVWSGTTLVPPHLLYRDPTSGRPLEYREADVDAYNKVATGVALAHGATIHALDAWVRPRLADLQIPNDIHFTSRGYAALGKQVAEFLRRMI